MPTLFEHLPQEILGMILYNLSPSIYPSLRLVHSSWDAYLRVHVFKTIHITRHSKLPSILSDMALSQSNNKYITPIGHLVTSVNMLANDDITGTDLKQLARHCPNVIKLIGNYDWIRNIDRDEEGFASLWEKLNDEYADYCGKKFDPPESQSVSFFFGSLDLTELTLFNVYPFSLVVKVILPPLVHLVRLNISVTEGYNNDTTEADQMFINPALYLDYIQDACPLLQYLHVTKFCPTLEERQLDSGMLQLQSIDDIYATLTTCASTIRPWPNLTELGLTMHFDEELNWDYWHVPILIYLTIKFPHLTRLDFDSPLYYQPSIYEVKKQFNDPTTPGHERIIATLLSLGFNFNNLSSFTINNIPLDPLAKHILFNHQSTPMLRNVDINNCIQGSNFNINRQTNFFQQSVFSHSLAKLHLYDNGVDFEDMLHHLPALNSIEDLALGTDHKKQSMPILLDDILDRSPHLKSLKLTQFDLGQSSSPATTYHPLEKLELKGIKTKSTDLFTLISVRCRHLTTLSLKTMIFKETTPTNHQWIEPYWDALCGLGYSERKPSRVTWITMPHTRLLSCTLDTICLGGHRYRYNNAACLLVQDSIHKPISLYAMERQVTYRMGGMDCLTNDRAHAILDRLCGGQGKLDRRDEECYKCIKKCGLIVLMCQDVEKLDFVA